MPIDRIIVWKLYHTIEAEVILIFPPPEYQKIVILLLTTIYREKRRIRDHGVIEYSSNFIYRHTFFQTCEVPVIPNFSASVISTFLLIF